MSERGTAGTQKHRQRPLIKAGDRSWQGLGKGLAMSWQELGNVLARRTRLPFAGVNANIHCAFLPQFAG
jgi:hypothetical protein